MRNRAPFHRAARAALLLLTAAAAATATPAAEARPDPLAAYGRLHAALAADRAEGVTAAAAELAAGAEAAGGGGPHAAAWGAVAKAARGVTGTDLAALREQAKPLSAALAKLVEAGALAGADIYYCSMAEGYWLQAKADEAVRNPYYGKSMLACGWKVDKVEG